MTKEVRISIIQEIKNNPEISISALAEKYHEKEANIRYTKRCVKEGKISPCVRAAEAVVYAEQHPEATISQIASIYKISRMCLSDAIKDKTGKKRARSALLKGPTCKSRKIIEYTEQHPELTLQEIGNKFGVSKQFVSWARRKYFSNKPRISAHTYISKTG